MMKEEGAESEKKRGGTLKGEENAEEIKSKEKILTEPVEIAVMF
jgi:hypothetical protein